MTGLPLWKVDLPFPCTNEEYEARMSAAAETSATTTEDRVATE
jgi:hypothetical protein